VLFLTLERGRSSPEGSRGWPLDGLAEVTWAMGSFLLQAMIVQSVIHGLWVRFVLLFCKKGVFPWSSGDPRGCPRHPSL
jgi:hypothetical protein